MDSTGLALLINTHRRIKRRGQGFAIVCPGGPISRVFEVADMVAVVVIPAGQIDRYGLHVSNMRALGRALKAVAVARQRSASTRSMS